MYDAIVVDGGNLSYRVALSPPRAQEPAELFLQSVLYACGRYGARGLHLTWDAGRGGRRAVWPQYKVGKGSDDKTEEVRRLASDVKRKVSAFAAFAGARSYVAPEWEADDVCATLARTLSAEGRRVLVLSGDKDLIQCLGPSVDVLRPGRSDERLITVRTFERESALIVSKGEGPGLPSVPSPAAAWLAYQSIRGDSSDGVPGVSGVGEVTARDALVAYPLDVFERLGVPGGFPALSKRARSALEAGGALGEALLSRELVRLRDDLPLCVTEGEHHPVRTVRSAARERGWRSVSSGAICGVDALRVDSA